ncbi:Ribonucleotide reductase transcriptional regulator NrdR [uncultured Gammaproteobacteria bacterium]|jgi:transcriptional repressor NrdR|uniref:Transcriptional repressor NrdR n=1 Tax=Bathymodiolus thermophilus thioautotrophic gill symbiont TaxID=2360 RepID=A0ABM8M5I6_9GAMM|nr:transcriptional regulator NrdR [Bathymodiolus thermophilus thioautotrophic gill symbiont]CAC9500571.1 Ribonucleotide reductase transcriptional regulator NrdR [uncultured Gammaproteobacteria bacterium]CAB5498313.1 Ribonucleotide reductase transcriptional regulator NrdR [Bathymodiolus thermophilus thioautotrophic gill symbiont]CAC9515584.1 Ribonucleotide reductase transcriptional regulator NrdR [uncultured Gammaproteobacteria bacterium]CAC9526272.1 Ribonucleotide reductase transcriptional regu
MRCPFCQSDETKVLETRLVADGAQVRRRRECSACNERYLTRETVDLNLPRLIKRDGARESFDEYKLCYGLLKALEKRPINATQIETSVHKLRMQSEHEVSSNKIGEWVMTELKALDEVAYIRFASVYRQFQDIKAFREEIDKLMK